MSSNQEVHQVKNAISYCTSEEYFTKKRKLIEQLQDTRESLAVFSENYSKFIECIEEAKVAIERFNKINKKGKKG